MAGIAESQFSGLSPLIREAEERRTEQTLYMAFLVADDADTDEAEDGLRQIKALLMRMRVQHFIYSRRA
ncbi:hypothetical protein [Methylobacterium iners]|uniref:Uncharacterized protein n=1 Tax=Methylobacterium iners TaxID=418707 RepID=A0ABQ4S418_9HYPH|nr:hypothetical protein [Methylobacterium iners]GJD96644.1 hypothetical protein OCOJLMKI_3867 [Methylobacterium iners]